MKDIKEIKPLLLSYLGDCAMEIIVRRYLVQKFNTNAECNRAALNFVTAPNQAKAAKKLLDVFTEDEKDIFTRAKNAKSHYTPKNTDVYTYRLATGLEAVFGYNALLDDSKRNEYLFKMGFDTESIC